MAHALDWVEAQRSDKVLGPIYRLLNGEVAVTELSRSLLEMAEMFVLRDNRLMRQQSDGIFRIVVPESLKTIILQACHDDSTAGHLGVSKTLKRIQT